MLESEVKRVEEMNRSQTDLFSIVWFFVVGFSFNKWNNLHDLTCASHFAPHSCWQAVAFFTCSISFYVLVVEGWVVGGGLMSLSSKAACLSL